MKKTKNRKYVTVNLDNVDTANDAKKGGKKLEAFGSGNRISRRLQSCEKNVGKKKKKNAKASSTTITKKKKKNPTTTMRKAA